jgi:acetyl-CoA synthetase
VLCGGEFLAEALREWSEDALDTTINVGYGLTEANALIGQCRALYPARGDSIGVPHLGHEVAIVDEDGERVPAGKIALKPLDPVLFQGYRQNSRIEESPDGELFYTGDRGYRDADGYYYYEGRSDGVIVSSDYRVSPREIERVLEGAPGVQEAVVGGVADDEFGEHIIAHVVPASGPNDAGNRIDSDDLTQRVRDRLGKHKAPHEIHELRDPPQTHSGKVDRSELFAE